MTSIESLSDVACMLSLLVNKVEERLAKKAVLPEHGYDTTPLLVEISSRLYNRWSASESTQVYFLVEKMNDSFTNFKPDAEMSYQH